jgi:hypothetical protein
LFEKLDGILGPEDNTITPSDVSGSSVKDRFGPYKDCVAENVVRREVFSQFEFPANSEKYREKLDANRNIPSLLMLTVPNGRSNFGERRRSSKAKQ